MRFLILVDWPWELRFPGLFLCEFCRIVCLWGGGICGFMSAEFGECVVFLSFLCWLYLVYICDIQVVIGLVQIVLCGVEFFL